MTSTIGPQVRTPQVTLSEYRSLEESATERHEYHDGKIVAMTGGSIEHSCIAGNFYLCLALAFKGTNFKPYNSDLRIWIPQYRKGVYPDISVIQGEPELHDGRRDEILNPCLIIEVLSASTEAYDRGDKFRYYRSIPSFSEYVLVSQTEAVIDRYQRTAQNQWVLETYQGLDATIELQTGNLKLAATDLYDGIKVNALS